MIWLIKGHVQFRINSLYPNKYTSECGQALEAIIHRNSQRGLHALHTSVVYLQNQILVATLKKLPHPPKI